MNDSKRCQRQSKSLILLIQLGLVFVAISSNSLAVNAQDGSRQESQVSRPDIDSRLRELGIELPDVSPVQGAYRRVVIVDNIAYLAGHVPIDDRGQIMVGKVGDGVSLELAQLAAQRSAIGMLASLKAELGSLNRVRRIVKTTGMVNCVDDFTEHPEVINGCSLLIAEIFGRENGIGARSAVGMSSLPRGAIVEIEAIFELHPIDPNQ